MISIEQFKLQIYIVYSLFKFINIKFHKFILIKRSIELRKHQSILNKTKLIDVNDRWIIGEDCVRVKFKRAISGGWLNRGQSYFHRSRE